MLLVLFLGTRYDVFLLPIYVVGLGKTSGSAGKIALFKSMSCIYNFEGCVMN
jgi:hypothetical protein